VYRCFPLIHSVSLWLCALALSFSFLDFYHLQTSSHPEESWKDLTKLGYNRALDLVRKSTAPTTTAQ
jgi:hypothetical protein